MSEIHTVTFSVYNRDVAADSSIPLITRYTDLNGSDLFDASGRCDKCYPITNYCRGHLGKILFNINHVRYIYQPRVKILLDMMHGRCNKPVRRSAKIDKSKHCDLYWKLVNEFGGRVCACTSNKSGGKVLEEDVKKLEEIYTYFESRNSDALKRIFNLDSRDKVLVNYLLLPSQSLLSQVHQGDVVCKEVNKLLNLLDNRGGKKSAENLLRNINSVYEALMSTLREKKGIMRKMCISRKIGNSARAVIKSDPYIGLEDVSVSEVIAPSLAAEVIMDEANMDYCVRMIINSMASQVKYDKKIYRLASSIVYICLCERSEAGLLNRCEQLAIGDSLTLDDATTVVYNKKDTITLINLINKSNRIELSRDLQGVTLVGNVPGWTLDRSRNHIFTEFSGNIFTQLFLEVTSKESVGGKAKVPLQLGCSLDIPIEGNPILMHRNPVLSADSLHKHYLRPFVSDKLNTLSIEQRQHQREKLEFENDNPIMCESKDLKYLPKTTKKLVRCDNNNDMYMYKFQLQDSVPNKVTDMSDAKSSIGINPMATTPYNADFDGDEMNGRVMPNELIEDSSVKNISLLADALKGTFGPIHDGRYGLYCIVDDKVSLSSVRYDYATVVAKSLIDKELKIDVTSLVECGLCLQEANDICCSGFLPNLNDKKFTLEKNLERLTDLIKSSTMYVNTGSYTQCVIDFVTNLRMYKDRKTIIDNKSYNRFFVEYSKTKLDMHEAAECYGRGNENNFQRILSNFYSDIGMCLYSLCDHYGVTFDSRDEKSALYLVNSRARPKMSTYDSIFDKIGNVSYVLPTERVTKYIEGNFGTGVSDEEYIHLCYQNRMSTVTKGITTAPEGDYMRLVCNYMSDVVIKKGAWYKDGKCVYKRMDLEEMANIEERLSSSGYQKLLCHLDEHSERLKYRDLSLMAEQVKSARLKVIHIGQRKLLMSEIDFLTDFSKKGDKVVYAGAAPGSHIPVLLALFPNISFDMYDTAKYGHILRNKVDNRVFDRLRLINDYITPDLAFKNYYDEKSRILFISDIRTNTNKQVDKHGFSKPTDDDVARDNELNRLIIEKMQPRASMIKFRLPYEKGNTLLPNGQVRLQCWTGYESTEARLVCSSPYEMIEYDHTDHEEKMFYHNMKRPHQIPDLVVDKIVKKQLNMKTKDIHYDVYREQQIVNKYVKVYKKEITYVYKCIQDVLGSDYKYYIESTFPSN